jgi:hypothetical protein
LPLEESLEQASIFLSMQSMHRLSKRWLGRLKTLSIPRTHAADLGTFRTGHNRSAEVTGNHSCRTVARSYHCILLLIYRCDTERKCLLSFILSGIFIHYLSWIFLVRFSRLQCPLSEAYQIPDNIKVTSYFFPNVISSWVQSTIKREQYWID